MTHAEPQFLETSDTTRTAWGRSGLRPRHDFYRAMTAGLPQGTVLKVELDHHGKLVSLHCGYDATGKDDRRFSFDRKFKHDGRIADHFMDYVGAGLRDQGIAKTFHRNLFPNVYEQTGVKRAEVYARSVGNFAWNKLGFSPVKKELPALSKRLEGMIDVIASYPPPQAQHLPAYYMQALRHSMDTKDPHDFWFLADQEVKYHGVELGKLILVSHEYRPAEFRALVARTPDEKLCRSKETWGWEGEMDLTDPRCVRRYRNYLYGEGHGKHHSVTVARRVGLGPRDIMQFMHVRPRGHGPRK
jgi:hypothetical protein